MSEQERKIPQFLENASQPYEGNLEVQPKPLKKTLILFGLLWLLGVFIYLQFFYGWSGLSTLIPSDFVMFLGAFFVFPLIIVMLLMFITKIYSTLKQNEMVEKTLNRFLKTNDENLLSKIINKTKLKSLTRRFNFYLHKLIH